MNTRESSIERPWSSPITRTRLLPFTVRLVNSAQDLAKAVEIRSSAYARHIPEIGQALIAPELDDYRDDVLLLIVESKLDGNILGSIRLQPNFNQPLRIEGEAELPPKFHGKRLIELMRLGVKNGRDGILVNYAIYKACYEICFRCGIDYIFAAGRSPVDRLYRALKFEDVLGGATVPLSYAAGLEHGIFALKVDDIDPLCKITYPAMYSFMAEEEHPDIAIDYSVVHKTFGYRKSPAHKFGETILP